MPTWLRPARYVLAKTRTSPGWRSSVLIWGPLASCPASLWGKETPNWLYTHITKPVQSKPDGDAPPQRYGLPTYCSAKSATSAPDSGFDVSAAPAPNCGIAGSATSAPDC